MLDLLDKRNCPVCGGMLKCENSDYAKPFREKELFLNVTYKESAIGRSSNPIMVTSSGAGRFITACACIRLELYQTVF